MDLLKKMDMFMGYDVDELVKEMKDSTNEACEEEEEEEEEFENKKKDTENGEA